MSAGNGSLPPTTVSLHICGITNDGNLWLTSRPTHPDGSAGSWSPWEEVKVAGVSNPGPFIRVSCVSTRRDVDGTSTDEELHLLGITQDGKLWHTSRIEQQNWQPFEDLTTLIGSAEGKFSNIQGNEFRGTLDICAITRTSQGEQRILHTTRDTKGKWSQFEDINQPQLADFPDSFVSADCVATFIVFLFGGLHVCGVTKDGKLRYTFHFQQPPWLPFAPVPSKNGPISFSNVSTALGIGGLHVCAQSEGNIWHTVLFSKPARWQAAFDNVKQLTSDPGTFSSIDCASLHNELHICGLTKDGKVWHTSVSSSSTTTPPDWQPVWRPFDDVTALLGGPGNLTFICITGDPSFWGPIGGGGDPTCEVIQASIDHDKLQMQGLKDRAKIAALQRAIADLQQKGHAHGCF